MPGAEWVIVPLVCADYCVGNLVTWACMGIQTVDLDLRLIEGYCYGRLIALYDRIQLERVHVFFLLIS